MRPQPNVWTCGAGLTEALARHVLAGFPLQQDGPHDLSRWTILVPTRRAARALEDRLFTLSGATALLLPRVRPIGDTDEDLLAGALPQEGIADAVTPMGQLFLFLTLIDEWAGDNPHLPLAQDVQASRSQALGLAQSLAELVTQLETEEVTADFSRVFEGLDLAGHRQTILSLMHLVQEQLPKRLREQKLMGPAARRNLLIRLEAERITADATSGPIIAAGSTGSNPATRDLLKAIARHPQGAVILPGLDLSLDDESWDAAGPNHPQFALKILLSHLETKRDLVQALVPATPREALAREIMRPAETSERWADAALLPAAVLSGARAGLTLVECPNRQIEARSIALLLRQVLEQPGESGALVTPDRDLAQMVAAELRRWAAEIDDSGGEPLIRFGRAQLCKLLIDCIEEDFAPASLVALLAHPAVTLGLGAAAVRLLAQRFELALLRQDLPPDGPARFAATLANVRRARAGDVHAHRVLRSMDDAAWDELADFTARLAAALLPLTTCPAGPLAAHVDCLATALSALAPDAPDAPHTGSDAAFADVLESLRQESLHHPEGSLRRALASVVWALQQETLRPQQRGRTRLSIYGLAEARMIDADHVILGGLNETIWPAAVDPGPWVNRSMRAALGLAQPERAIGQTAHDLVQGLLHRSVAVTWSKRAGTAPLMPSRWILRLRALLLKASIEVAEQIDGHVPGLAMALDAAAAVKPWPMPRPAPPVSLRPRHLSVTEIEKLIRDPYAIFARHVLGLQPLENLGGAVEPRLRGILFHDALRRYADSGERSLAGLLQAGQEAFSPYITHPDVRHFWWPRFKRMATAFVAEDAALHTGIVASLTERKARLGLVIAGVEHSLRARIDRIDVTMRGTARIIDYKTGAVPTAKQIETGLNPQLTLEAAILRHGECEGLPPAEVEDLVYIRTSGGRPPLEVSPLSAMKGLADVRAVAEAHLAGLRTLLERYLDTGQPYVPRAAMFKERDASDYDHLSRFAEWSRGGT
jgi:ATP-dependent helicase/nuclease subunit B